MKGYRVAFDFWGCRCDVEVEFKSDAEHFLNYFADHVSGNGPADVSLMLLAAGEAFVPSLLRNDVEKTIYVKQADGEWALWDQFFSRSTRPSPLPPLFFPPLLGSVSALHAAAVAPDDGAALLLVGPSFSGKSVMSISAMLRGWQCLTDDLAIILDDRMVHPFRRPIGIRENTLRLIPDLADILATKQLTEVCLPEFTTWMVRHKHFPNQEQVQPRAIDKIIFLREEAVVEPSLTSLESETVNDRIQPYIKGTKAPTFLGDFPSWELTYELDTQLDEAVSLVLGEPL